MTVTGVRFSLCWIQAPGALTAGALTPKGLYLVLG